MVIFGERAFGEVIRLNEVLRVGPWSKMTGVRVRRADTSDLSHSTGAQRKGHGRHSEKVAVHKPGREPAPETGFAGTLITDFQPPELRENKCLLSKPHSLCYFVVVAHED